MKIVRQISDHLCAEHWLSIVENPQPSRGSYRDWQEKKEPQSNKDKLRELIDNSISAGMVFEQFIGAMHCAGCEVKRGKHLGFKVPGAERFVRMKSLGDDYTQEALRERCFGTRTVATRQTSDGQAERKAAAYAESADNKNTPNLLIDIQAKLREGTGEGYRQWAKVFNLKQMAKTLLWLKENSINSYDDLKRRTAAASGEFRSTNNKLRDIETKQKSIAELQKQIGVYTKMRNTYVAYIKSGKDPVFYEANRADITLCKAAKRYFDEQGFKGKLPSINLLKQEWAALDAERKKLY
jgi:hypothetical protein